MKTLTQTLLTSLALTLGACDAGDAFVDGDTALRPGGGWGGGLQLNTNFIGGHDNSELDLDGQFHKHARLDRVCLSPKHADIQKPVCLIAGKDTIDVKDGMIIGAKGGQNFHGVAFKASDWLLQIDHDKDGVLDSTVTLRILDARSVATTPTGSAAPVEYWNYHWAYDPGTATGHLAAILKKGEQKSGTFVPTCEPDVDTDSLGTVVLGDTSIETRPDHVTGDVEEKARVMFTACHSGAVGKAPRWGYVLHKIGHKYYENIIRMIRADYCGDGDSWTEPGQAVALTDKALGVHYEFDAAYSFEGVVSLESGWVCVDTPRLSPVYTYNDVKSACGIPTCKDMGGDIMVQNP